jgi:hypothetical protein
MEEGSSSIMTARVLESVGDSPTSSELKFLSETIGRFKVHPEDFYDLFEDKFGPTDYETVADIYYSRHNPAVKIGPFTSDEV